MRDEWSCPQESDAPIIGGRGGYPRTSGTGENRAISFLDGVGAFGAVAFCKDFTA